MLLSQDKPFLPQDWIGKFSTLKSLGFEGFEIDGRILLDQFDRIAHASQITQFPIVTICGGYLGWIGDFDETKRLNCMNDIEAMLLKGQKIGIKGIIVPAAWGMFSKRLPPMIPPRSDEEDVQVLLKSLRYLNQIAHQTETTIYLEPLNRYEDHMLNTIKDAAKLIIKGSLDHVKICYDFFHMNIEEPEMDKPIHQFSELIGHIHLASSHRYQPGTGHLDYAPGLKALHSIGYQGDYAIECRVMGSDLLQAYQESAQYVKKLLSENGLIDV
jgi:sugar phosphate isomerase/epimerase